MSGYQGYPQGQWSGGYDEGRARAWAPGNTDEQYGQSEIDPFVTAPMSRVMPGGYDERRARAWAPGNTDEQYSHSEIDPFVTAPMSRVMPGGYDKRRARAPENPPDGWYNEMSMADSAPMSRVMPGGRETYKRPAPYSWEDITGDPNAKRSRFETGGAPVRGQGQAADWRYGMIDAADRPRTLFVFNLMPNTTASDLFQYFVKFGDLMKFDVFNNDEGKCTGTGIVQFVNEEDAVAALSAQPLFIHKKQIIISRDREDDPKTNVDVKKSLETHKLFVTDIPLDVSEEDLCEYFSQWGNISFCDVTGKAKWTRHVLVSYTNYEDAIKCLKTPHNYGQSVINVSVATHCKALRDHDHKRGGNRAGEYAILKRKNSLFVSNIPDDVIPEELTEHFSMLGEIVSCKLGGKLRQNNNFGFVRFKERDDALKAVIMPHTLKNQRIFVHVSERKSSYLLKASKDPDIMSAIEEKAQSCYLYVPDMNASTTEDQLYEHFKTYGGLASCMIISNAAHPHSAHLAYANEADAARCFHDDNHFVNNEKLTVLWSDWTKWGGEDRRGLPPRPASPPRDDTHAGPPKHSRRAGRSKHSRRAGRSRHKRRGNHPRFDRRGNPPRHTGPDRDDGLDYPQCEAEFEFDDGCVSSWNC